MVTHSLRPGANGYDHARWSDTAHHHTAKRRLRDRHDISDVPLDLLLRWTDWRMTARRCVAGIAHQMNSTLLSESRSTQNYRVAMRARFKAAARHTSDIYPVLHWFPYQCGRPPHERNCGRPCNFLLLCPSFCLVILLVPQTLLSGGHGSHKFAPPTVPESSEDHSGGGCQAFCTERIPRRAAIVSFCTPSNANSFSPHK